MIDCISSVVNVEPALHPWDKFHVIVVYNYFDALLDSIINILFRTFAYAFVTILVYSCNFTCYSFSALKI